MKYFDKPDGSKWAFESDGSQDHLITSDMVPSVPPDSLPVYVPTKDDEIAAVLAPRGWSRANLWGFLTGCIALQTATAALEGKTVAECEAYMHSSNPAYRAAKALEATCVAIEKRPD